MIHVDRLTKRFGDFTAVCDISLNVRRGEVFAFLGPNGSGKTTTLKSMSGLIVPTSGRVLLNGIDVHREPQRALRGLSYLPQRVLFPHTLTARELIRFYGTLRGIPRKTADQILEGAHFNGAADKRVGEFSGGMLQRLGLAICTLPDAPVLLLDEPTASLDPQGVKTFREFILAQRRRGKTIVFSTHLLHEVEQLADRAAIFVGGKIVAIESVESLRQTASAHSTLEDVYLHYVESSQQRVFPTA